MIKRMGAAIAATALVCAPLQAACWNEPEVAAGTVRDLQSMLMVATLRCQVMHIDITADYNAFLNANKATIQKLNERLKAHFIKTSGAVGGQRAYDSFVTSLANAYGAHESGNEVCQSMAALEREAALMSGDEAGLILLAQRQGIATAFPEGACTIARSSVAMAMPAASAIPAAAAPVATPVAAEASSVRAVAMEGPPQE